MAHQVLNALYNSSLQERDAHTPPSKSRPTFAAPEGLEVFNLIEEGKGCASAVYMQNERSAAGGDRSNDRRVAMASPCNHDDAVEIQRAPPLRRFQFRPRSAQDVRWIFSKTRPGQNDFALVSHFLQTPAQKPGIPPEKAWISLKTLRRACEPFAHK